MGRGGCAGVSSLTHTLAALEGNLRGRFRFGPGAEAGGTVTVRPRYPTMLKLAAILLVLMIVFGVLGFVMHVAVALTKIAFFICLVGLVISVIGKMLRGAQS